MKMKNSIIMGRFSIIFIIVAPPYLFPEIIEWHPYLQTNMLKNKTMKGTKRLSGATFDRYATTLLQFTIRSIISSSA